MILSAQANSAYQTRWLSKTPIAQANSASAYQTRWLSKTPIAQANSAYQTRWLSNTPIPIAHELSYKKKPEPSFYHISVHNVLTEPEIGSS